MPHDSPRTAFGRLPISLPAAQRVSRNMLCIILYVIPAASSSLSIFAGSVDIPEAHASAVPSTRRSCSRRNDRPWEKAQTSETRAPGAWIHGRLKKRRARGQLARFGYAEREEVDAARALPEARHGIILLLIRAAQQPIGSFHVTDNQHRQPLQDHGAE